MSVGSSLYGGSFVQATFDRFTRSQFSNNFPPFLNWRPLTELTHFDDSGNARMVDVGQKPETSRMATASAIIRMKPETLRLIQNQEVAKGDVLGIARVAGIGGSKRTSDLIPLCHPLRIISVDIEFQPVDDSCIRAEATVRAIDRTGVEMEALAAVTTAALTIYDMCKSVDRAMTITDVQLEHKSGGKSGLYQRTKQQPNSRQP